MNDYDKDIIEQLKLIENALLQVGRQQHNLVVSLKKYCEERENGQDTA